MREPKTLLPDGTLQAELAEFFDHILKDNSAYKVFVGRECSILLIIASSLKSEDLQNRNDIMSDVGFLAHADEIVEYYIIHRTFPSICLVDESITYGRALNTILLEWEQVLVKRFQKHGISMLSSNLRKQLSASLKIRVFMQKCEDTLLMESYKSAIERAFSFCSFEGFDKTYSRLQQILSESDKVNAVYTVSCQMNPNCTATIKNFLLKNQYSLVLPEPIIDEDHELPFQKYCVFLRYFPNSKAPKAISAIRMFERNQKAHLIPYVYFMDLDQDVSGNIADEIDNNFGLRLGEWSLSELGEFGRIQSELTATIINYKLLQSLVSEAGLKEHSFSFDYDQVKLSLGGDVRSRDLLKEIHDQDVLPFDVYHQWIAYIAAGSDAPFGYFETASHTTSPRMKRRIRNIARELIYQKSINAECAAYHALNGGLTQKMLHSGGKSFSIAQFLKDLYNESRKRGCQFDIDQIIAQLMLMMDHGYTATVTYNVTTKTEKVLSHLMRVSECSLELYPIAYAEYIPLLIEMDKQCLGNWRDMKEQITQYIPENFDQPDLAHDLWCMTKGVHKIGRNMDSLAWYAENQGVSMGQDNPEVQKYRRWFFDY